MRNSKWLWLQLFADGGDGGAGAAGDGGAAAATTGDNTAADPAAGDNRLRELGVPEDVLQRRAQRGNRNGRKAATAPAPAAQEAAAPTSNNTPEESTGTPAPARMSWKEIMDDPEYNKEMQRTVQQRLGKAKAAEDAMGDLSPALELLARHYGLDAENIDAKALAKAISDDDGYYEDKALELGVPVETAKQIDRTERDAARQKRQEAATIEEQRIEQHFSKMQADAAALKQKFPGFDLMNELKNPTFVRLTAPGSGLSVEDAYYAIHREEIQAAANANVARNVANRMANNIRSGSARPAENGTSSQAPSVTSFDYKRASREEREALKARIYAADARGEKLYPGQR